MIASWMFYASVVGLLVGAAAVSAERIFRDHHLPTRWIWCASLLISLTAPALSRLFPESPSTLVVRGATDPSPISSSFQPWVLTIGEQMGALLVQIESFLVRGWGLGSFLLFAMVGVSVLRLRKARASWREDHVDGTPVLVSSDVGPAVLGVFRHRIVLPAWVLHRSNEARGLILAHEREHVRARDPLLVVASALPSLLVPWHLPLWWQYRRLRLAVEMDCDERVLDHAAPGLRRRYGHLLLEVGRRKSGVLALAAPFSEERSFLGRRIRGLAETAPAHRLRRGAMLTVVAVLLMVAAWSLPRPAVPATSELMAASEAPAAGPSGSDQSGEALSVLSPLSLAALAQEGRAFPQPADAGSMTASTALAAPALPPATESTLLAVQELASGGVVIATSASEISGETAGALVSDDDVEPAVLEPASSASPADPTRDIVRPAFPPITPLVYADHVIPGIDPSAIQLDAEATEDVDFASASAGTPVRPQILNAGEIQKQMVRRYPTHLLEAGIGGTVVLDFFVDESGVPTEWQIVQSSGHQLLDEAALKMASTFRFSPARTRRDQVVPVWTRFPIRFQVL